MGSQERSVFCPQHWSYAEAHDALEVAGGLIDVEKAERRNLILRNAMTGNDWATSRTLVCAYQMILPGEVAPSHRHTSNALRVIIDGTGSYSVVDGDKMPMNAGDVVLTPGGHWHGHGHEGDTPAYWLDCLDVPLTYLLEPMYFEPHPAKYEPVERIVEESPFRFSCDSIAGGLDKAKVDGEGRHGPRITLETPSMPAIGLVIERLEAGKNWAERRTTSNRLFTVMSGAGSSNVAGNAVSWSRGDTFLVPSSNWVGHRASQDAVLLEMSDEPLMRFANYFQHDYR
jgi:gentisate 1,2-dioxygenase